MPFRKTFALAVSMLALAPAHAAVTYDRLYVFGDSLVDTGNAQIGALGLGLPDPAPAGSGYYQGRFSNGPNYADDLSQRLGLGASTAYLLGGTNYAVGGATTAPVDPAKDPDDAVIPSFQQQITLYEKSLTGSTPPGYPKTTRPKIDANSLVLVTIGGNDIRDALKYGTPDLADSVTDFGLGLKSLIDDGARNIIVVGLPDIGKIPSVVNLGAGVSSFASTLAYGLNNSYATVAGLANAGLAGTGNVSFFNLFAFQDAAEGDPASYGLDKSLLTHDCVDDAAQSTGCSGYLFFDGIHPTAQVHGLIADAIATQVGIPPLPEASTWMMMILGFGATGAALRARRRSTQPA